MKLNRLKINQMVDRGDVSIGGRRSGGGSGAGGGGGVSQQWVDENYVSKDFFSRLFTIHGTDENDDPVVIDPNDTATTLDSIEAMVGLWTEQYLSALGQNPGGSGGGGGGALYLLADVIPDSYSDPQMVYGLTGDRSLDNGKVLTYSGEMGSWIAAAPTGGGSVTSITLQTPSGMLVNGYSSETITGDGTFNITFADGYYLASTQDLEFIERIIWGTWWGCELDEYGHVAGAMSMVPSINNLLFFNMDSQQNYSDIELRTRFGSKFLFTNDNVGMSMLKVRNTGETDDTIVFEVESSELVINEDPVDGSQKSLALKGYSWIDFYTADTWRMIIDSDGCVGIGNASPVTKLDVNGGVKAEKFYLLKPNAANDVGAIYFQVEYNSSNVATGVHLYGGGMSADTYVTALGVGSSSGGSGGATSLSQLSDVNPNMNPQAGDVLTFINGEWTAGSAGGVGTVTSISVGTGLATSTGQPITGSGTISLSTTYQEYAEHGESIYQTRNNYLLKADVKTLQIKGGSTNVLTYDPTGANKTITITAESPLTVDTATSNTIKIKMSQIANLADTYTKVTVDAYGRVTAGFKPTTLSEYGITDAVVGIVKGSGGHANDIGVKFKNNSEGSWITVPFASNAASATNATNAVNATKATQLTTTNKTAWGQTYWTSGGVPTTIKGNLTDDNFQLFSSSSNPYLRLGTSSSTWRVQLLNNILYFGVGTSTSLKINGSGNVGIGGPVNMSYILNITGAVYMSSKLDVNGIATVGNLKSNGYVTALSSSSSSDERMKNIIEHFVLSIEDIANAPIVKFTWKNNEDKAVHAGSIAQYWEKKLPESVLEVEGFLTLEYGVLALLSVISLAREVVNLKQRVARIEEELFN